MVLHASLGVLRILRWWSTPINNGLWASDLQKQTIQLRSSEEQSAPFKSGTAFWGQSAPDRLWSPLLAPASKVPTRRSRSLRYSHRRLTDDAQMLPMPPRLSLSQMRLPKCLSQTTQMAHGASLPGASHQMPLQVQ